MKTLFILLYLGISQIMFAPDIDKLVLEQRQALHVKEKMLEELRLAELTPQNLYAALTMLGVRNPEIVFKQAILETGHFKSKACVTYHNLFGMHYTKSRITLSTGYFWGDYYNGQFHKVSKYANWFDSVVDYSIWQDHMLGKHKPEAISRKLSNAEYYTFLNKIGYAASPYYVRTLKSIKISKYLS